MDEIVLDSPVDRAAVLVTAAATGTLYESPSDEITLAYFLDAGAISRFRSRLEDCQVEGFDAGRLLAKLGSPTWMEIARLKNRTVRITPG